MGEVCQVCFRRFRVPGEQHDDAIHCANSPEENFVCRSEAECLRLGIAARDERLASAKALNDRSRFLLIRVRGVLDSAIEETKPEVEGG